MPTQRTSYRVPLDEQTARRMQAQWIETFMRVRCSREDERLVALYYFGLSDREIGRLLSTPGAKMSARRARRWRRTGAGPGPALSSLPWENVDDLISVALYLLHEGILDRYAIIAWLHSPYPEFQWRRPIDLLARRRVTRLRRVICRALYQSGDLDISDDRDPLRVVMYAAEDFTHERLPATHPAVMMRRDPPTQACN